MVVIDDPTATSFTPVAHCPSQFPQSLRARNHISLFRELRKIRRQRLDLRLGKELLGTFAEDCEA